MTNTVKFSQFATASLNTNPNKFVGYGAGTNFQTIFPYQWTTAQRPSPAYNGAFGYNTDLDEYEYYDASATAWAQLVTGGIGVTQIDTGTGLTGGPITATGTISFAPIAANSFWANTSGVTAVPSVTSLGAFLLSANNLSDVASASTSRTNLGLAIGTNVEAWNHLLDEIAAGTWTGATSITMLGTIATGTWQGSEVTVPYGGTGNNTFTAYSVICAGTSATAAFQNVSGLGTLGQILTSNGPGALPTWQSVSGTGTVSAGLINELAWYAASGDTVSGLSTANNGVLVTSNAGVPSISSTLPAAVQGNITAVGTIGSGTWQGTVVGMTYGGTGADLSPTANNLVYSTASKMALFATGDNGVLVTDGSGVPSISSTLPSAVQNNITAVGTVASGAWNGSTITVPYGGTGLTTVTAYAVLCGGTTATDAFQQVSGLGTLGQVLTSQGAGGLPTWTNASGTGTVSSGTTNELAWYAANGTTVSGLTTGNSGVLITSSGGVPSISSTLPTAVQGNITEVGTVATGVWEGSNIGVAYGGTGNDTFTAYSVLCAGTTATGAFQNVSGLGSSGQVLISQGAGALPAWGNVSGTGTVNSGTINQLAYYAASGTAVSGLSTADNGTLITSGSGVPSISSTLPAAVQGNITALGTIATGVWNGTIITLAYGGTNADLTASNGGIFYSTASAGAILAGTATAGQLLLSGASAAPTWSSTTYPSTNAINTLLYASGANQMAALATANNGVLVTSGSGVPSISTTLPTNIAVTTPEITTGIKDANGNEIIGFTATASAVNYITITNAVTTASPTLAVAGSDTNIGLNIETKGTGNITLYGDGSSVPLFQVINGSNSNVNYLTLTASTTTNPVLLMVNGTDTNINLELSGKGTGGVVIQGTSAASAGNAPTGYVGEFVSSAILVASAVSCTSTDARNVTSISLSAGDWDVWGNVYFTVGGLSTQLYCWISSTSATLPDVSLVTGDNPGSGNIGSQGFACAAQRFNVGSAGATVYLSCSATFSTSTVTACGGIYARRRR